ncbi:MAG: HAMP domain-containing histidine kinase, partial [Bacteroidales bacterium]|nr:HAMP domain-containing histidine kinase [Bacteroidales bacterium]
VFRSNDSIFVMGIYDGFKKKLLKSPHWVSLTCICKSDNYLLAIYFEHQQRLILNEMIILPVMSGLFLLILVFSFFFTIYAMIRQKKLSEIKTDFVNNMTHEFKTPISTISVSSEMLTKDKVIESPEKIKKYARIIFDENTILKNQVERVLQIAIIDKKDFKLKMKDLNVHEIIQSCIDNFKIIVGERNGKLDTSLKAGQHTIIADIVHLTNIINNLLDNANKYSFETPEILITTINLKGKIEITVEDKGIGINKENLNDIFKKFHRIQTGDIHNVKGFGLGLFYVKTMIEEMGGTIEVKSEINKGSSFILYFPV